MSTLPQVLGYRGPLHALRPLLEQLCAVAPRERWMSRRLSRGAVVGLCWTADGHLRLRIVRPGVPVLDAQQRAWAHELATFRRHLDAERWLPVPCSARPGTVAAEFRSPAPVTLTPATLYQEALSL